MQNPNEDTEWNDILRKHNILPAKEPNVTEEALADMIDITIAQKQSAEGRLGHLDLDELNEVEDDEDEEIIRMFREKRMAELKLKENLNKFGEVEEISAVDYVNKVNKAGEGVWVILHLYKQGITLCSLLNQFLSRLSAKYSQVKCLKSISTTCIPNYPDINLPTIFVYYEGVIKKQFVGPLAFRGENLKYEEFERMLAKTNAFKTDLPDNEEENFKSKDIFLSYKDEDENSDDENDW